MLNPCLRQRVACKIRLAGRMGCKPSQREATSLTKPSSYRQPAPVSATGMKAPKGMRQRCGYREQSECTPVHGLNSSAKLATAGAPAKRVGLGVRAAETAALIPPLRLHRHRYPEVLASHSPQRAQVAALARPATPPSPAPLPVADPVQHAEPSPARIPGLDPGWPAHVAHRSGTRRPNPWPTGQTPRHPCPPSSSTSAWAISPAPLPRFACRACPPGSTARTSRVCRCARSDDSSL